MDDVTDALSDDDRRSNLCADVVSLTRLEPGLAYLLRQAAGTWVAVSQLYDLSATTSDPDLPYLTTTWLPAPPNAVPDSVVIVFFDADSLWSMIAYYYAADNVLRTHPTPPSAVG